MSCCGGNCGCGAGCKCGSGCGGCKMFPDVTENNTRDTFVLGVAITSKVNFEESGLASASESSAMASPPILSRWRLQAYADADWAGCPDTCRSTTVSKSTAEAEYRALSSACSELTWLRGFLQTLTFPTPPSPLYADNMSAIRIASNPVFHERTKHIEVDCHFIRNMYLAGAITLPYIASEHQIVDIFTKPMTIA
ncbi:hypothetical protein SLEP1_g46591 [Rubroshorea leprosula]|uniref:Metallothionein-like protein n=1 Tax=Rubroshorea leprosula TaxID=152421 RepID=A0AAV5LQ72_9ROSI|nr:hypothetical protein SLEP1_g46591 [Rubroshorea leprosula]